VDLLRGSCQLVTDLLQGNWCNVTDLLWTCHLCCRLFWGLATGKSPTCYRLAMGKVVSWILSFSGLNHCLQCMMTGMAGASESWVQI